VTFSERKIGQSVFRVQCSERLEGQAAWLLSYFEQMQEEGISFFPGMRIQLGWSMLELRAVDGNAYLAYEPNFSKNPFTDFRDDVSVTLQVLSSQTAFINQFGIAPVRVSFQDKVIFAKGAMAGDSVYLERVPPIPERGDSGWFIGLREGSNDPSNLQAAYVYQLLHLRPSLLQFLLLPDGYLVVLTGDEVEAIFDRDGKLVERK